jgi:hypothetical protein
MAITVIDGPDKFMFSRNPVEIKLLGTAYIKTAGVYAATTITFTAPSTVAGEHLTISSDVGEADLISEDLPVTADGDHFQTQGVLSFEDWLLAFAEDLTHNYFIDTNYTLTINTSLKRISFSAKEFGPEHELTITSIPGTGSVTSTVAGVAQKLNDNYKLFVEVVDTYAEQSTVLECYFESFFLIDNAGLFAARLETVLDAYIPRLFPSASELIQYLDNYNIRPYHLRYFEFYGETPRARHYYLNDNADEYFYAIAGGINNREWPSSEFITNYAALVPGQTVPFLTWQPRTKKVYPNQPEFLAFYNMNWADWNSDGYVRITIYYSDATTQTNNVLLEFTRDTASGVICFAAGYQQIIAGIANPLKTVTKWTVQAFSFYEDINLHPITELFTFVLIEEVVPVYTRFILFQNSFYCFDTLACTGKRQKGIDVTGEILMKYLPANYSEHEGEKVDSESEAFETFVFSTGILSKAEMLEYLQELLVSSNVQEVAMDADTSGVTFMPFNLVKKSVRIVEDMQTRDRYYLQFEVKDASRYLGHGKIVV